MDLEEHHKNEDLNLDPDPIIVEHLIKIPLEYLWKAKDIRRALQDVRKGESDGFRS